MKQGSDPWNKASVTIVAIITLPKPTSEIAHLGKNIRDAQGPLNCFRHDGNIVPGIENHVIAIHLEVGPLLKLKTLDSIRIWDPRLRRHCPIGCPRSLLYWTGA